MFSFIKSKNTEKNDEYNILFSNVASLLIHAAKIDENYSDKEKVIIEKTILDLGAEEKEISKIMQIAEQKEEKSNQLLDFTKEVKNLNEDDKKRIIESLWKIIYSDDTSDMYESNLMRRLTGLLYLDNKIVGEIKEKIKSNLK